MSRWQVHVPDRVRQQIREVPDTNTQAQVLIWITEHLPADPYLRPHAMPITSAQRAKRKCYHVRFGHQWRLIYLILPLLHEVFVYDVVRHQDDYLYSKKYVERMMRASRRNPAALDDRIRRVLLENPAWGDSRVAEAAGCSPAAVRARRVAWGVPARNALPWLA